MAKDTSVQIINGTPVSPGLVEGCIHLHGDSLITKDTIGTDDDSFRVEKELEHLENAADKISDDLVTLGLRVGEEIDTRLAEVFEVHLQIVNDSSLREELRREIIENLVSAGSAVKTVFLRWEKRFLLMESNIARNKSDDMQDISVRFCDALAGITVHPLDEIPYGCILATRRLLPSDTIFLHSRNTIAVLLEFGNTGSHASLFVREMGLPCISGIRNIQTRVPDRAEALVDADSGTVTIRPSKKQVFAFHQKLYHKEQIDNIARIHAMTPAQTSDGVKIAVLANVGSADDTVRAMQNGAEGVGLYRMERLYLGSIAPPDVDELLGEMYRTLEPAKGKKVCVRLPDIGGDKPLPFLRFMVEANPSLGRRGIRMLREYPELLITHLRAVLELSRNFDVSVLIPMVTLPDDVELVRYHLMHLVSQLSLISLPKIGVMIETPAAALSACEISRHADFLSFGTNDLTQYTFAADRENAAVEQYFDDTSDVIFRMLRIVHDDVPDMPLSICGELGAHPEYIQRLIGCGIRTFSVSPPLIPMIKETIRISSAAEPLTAHPVSR